MAASARAIHMAWPGLAALLVLCGCGESPDLQPTIKSVSAPSAPSWFIDVTSEWGVDFVHDPGPFDGEYFLPQINGSGAALFDFDNDGRLDIYVLQGGGPNSTSNNCLYQQLSTGKFRDVSRESGLDINGFNTGVAIGDVNNDGWQDVLVMQYLNVRLFLNQGNGKFEDFTIRSGLNNPHWGCSASFVDYDRDGWLDLVMVNYVEFEESRYCTLQAGKRDFCPPNQFPNSITRLCRNLGLDESHAWRGFEDCTVSAGFDKAPGPGLGVLCGDFNGDHWPDIFVTNDMRANHLWINQKNGKFNEEGVLRGVAFNARGEAQSNMGVAYGDVDGDGLSDLFVTLFMGQQHALWKQEPLGYFHEQGAQFGISRSLWHGTGWGAVFADFDHSGSLDLALVNGFVQRHGESTESCWQPYKDRNQVLANDGTGWLRDVSLDNPALCDVPNVGRGLCMGDIDGDGAVDLLVTQIGGPVRILRNVAPDRGHWLIVRAWDPALQRDAIGAEVRVFAGGRQWQRLIQPSQSFQCSHEPRAHFGLGQLDRVEALEVLWPDGSSERFDCPRVDCRVELQRGRGKTLFTIEKGSQ